MQKEDTMEETMQNGGTGRSLATGILRVAVSLIVPVISFVLLYAAFIFMRDSEASRLLIAAVALVVGVFGVWLIYIGTDMVVSLLPAGIRERVRPFVFVGPAIVILTAYVVMPAVSSLYLSFLDARADEFVGLANYVFAFTDPAMLIVLRNNLLWLIFVTAFAVGMGLVIAVMADRVGRWEPVVKSLIFLPMAISAVGASVIWKFVYAFRPAGAEQIGLLNAVVTALGGDPQGWLLLRPWNNFFCAPSMFSSKRESRSFSSREAAPPTRPIRDSRIDQCTTSIC
jgi:alpha-glucoside transport system permease protein